MEDLDKSISKRLDALGWALFFIWLGVYLFLDIEQNGIFSLVLGIIIFFENALRKYLDAPTSKFWIIMSILFIVTGVLGFYNINLLPMLLILCGILIFIRSVLIPSKK